MNIKAKLEILLQNPQYLEAQFKLLKQKESEKPSNGHQRDKPLMQEIEQIWRHESDMRLKIIRTELEKLEQKNNGLSRMDNKLSHMEQWKNSVYEFMARKSESTVVKVQKELEYNTWKYGQQPIDIEDMEMEGRTVLYQEPSENVEFQKISPQSKTGKKLDNKDNTEEIVLALSVKNSPSFYEQHNGDERPVVSKCGK